MHPDDGSLYGPSLLSRVSESIRLRTSRGGSFGPGPARISPERMFLPCPVDETIRADRTWLTGVHGSVGTSKGHVSLFNGGSR